MGAAFVGSVEAAVPFDADGFAARLAEFMAHPNALILLLDDGTEAVGGLGAFCAPHFLFLRPMMATELFWWVEPDYRGGTAALRLLDYYEQWAAAKGCGVVTFSMFAGDEKLRRLLDRRGFRHCECAFAKDVVAVERDAAAA